MSKSYEVRILNPAAGRGYTSLKCAKRYVGEKRADWVAPDGAGGWDVVNERPNMPRLVLRFREQDERVQAVLRCAEKRQLDRVYDTAAGSGMATLEQIENLPVTRPMDLLVVRTRRREPKPPPKPEWHEIVHTNEEYRQRYGRSA